mmetsp:Transcript_46966/g.114598  ORF Transcript_46966/g.114598 Transcript_46966/m.114598 type:complete len:108 (-) Transcript_46966:8-331(-)
MYYLRSWRMHHTHSIHTVSECDSIRDSFSTKTEPNRLALSHLEARDFDHGHCGELFFTISLERGTTITCLHSRYDLRRGSSSRRLHHSLWSLGSMHGIIIGMDRRSH